jgi:hypothetical protein
MVLMKISKYTALLSLILFTSKPAGAQDTLRKNSILVETNIMISSSISYNRIIPGKSVEFYLGAGYVRGTPFKRCRVNAGRISRRSGDPLPEKTQDGDYSR